MQVNTIISYAEYNELSAIWNRFWWLKSGKLVVKCAHISSHKNKKETILVFKSVTVVFVVFFGEIFRTEKLNAYEKC